VERLMVKFVFVIFDSYQIEQCSRYKLCLKSGHCWRRQPVN